MLALVLASVLTWTMPRYAAWPDCTPQPGAPAGTKYLRVWSMNLSLPASSPDFHRWRLLYRLTAPRAGMWDGAARRITVPTYLCAPGDSCAARVAVGDSVLNWNCRDSEINWRVPMKDPTPAGEQP